MVSRTTAAPGGPSGTVHYIYDTGGHLIAEADAATGVTTREYIWLPANDNSPVDLPIAIAEAGAIYHVHADHLGRPTAMTDGSKATVWQATWKPWGEIQSISGTLANNLRYPGQYFQIETSLHYNWHRHYDPVTGRYTQPDPLGFVDGPSIYAYARSSPYMHTDRDGRIVPIAARLLWGIRVCREITAKLPGHHCRHGCPTRAQASWLPNAATPHHSAATTMVSAAASHSRRRWWT